MSVIKLFVQFPLTSLVVHYCYHFPTVSFLKLLLPFSNFIALSPINRPMFGTPYPSLPSYRRRYIFAQSFFLVWRACSCTCSISERIHRDRIRRTHKCAPVTCPSWSRSAPVPLLLSPPLPQQLQFAPSLTSCGWSSRPVILRICWQ